MDLLEKYSARLDPRVATFVFDRVKRLPFVRRSVAKEMDAIMASLERKAKPYRDRYTSYDRLPIEGRERAQILDEMSQIQQHEEQIWRSGQVSGAVYHGDQAHIDFVNRVYALQSQCNPLHADVWPSAAKFEAEIVAMTAHMLGAGAALRGEIVGCVTSGGTESILLAVKSYRDRARATKRIRQPELVLPITAHVAFDKAAHYFGIKLRRIPVDKNGRADVAAAAAAINRNSIALVGSAPSFPHGVIDPIAELSALALRRKIGFHTDACLGGFVLPWAERLGYPVPAFDFRLPGVTSMSADTHKFGYAPKGTSVVLYRGAELRRYQYFTATDWPGGLYFSPTMAGSRPGALSAACWATLVSIGERGYLAAAEQILRTAARLRDEVKKLPELFPVGDGLFVVAFGSHDLDIYRVMDAMAERGWSLNGLHRPACVHICITLRHTQPGVVEKFAADLRAAVEHARQHAGDKHGMAPVYGMAGTLPVRSLVGDLLKSYIDVLYKV